MLNEKIPLVVLTTGGTIEKIYDEADGSLQNRETVVKNKIIKRLRLPYSDITVKSLMSKDSLLMDDKDRSTILSAIKSREKNKQPIIVLHGTDTLDQTARYCFEKHHGISVPVIFTGAMKPLGFDDSDALQNVIEAIFAARILLPGYYATFHGKLYLIPNIRKNKKLGTFEEIE
ncbi:MAG TPA: asparaginase domain-containing protein [Bacteriovoracaceae bacterium]|nr:asparaginase domain-containing protein [Bacteriovoracaceae bacterium]